MSKKMLIDATHPEETRVVVLENGRVDELDVDTSTKKQIKGNIYLAKIVRVEPSLQAAFIDYGGNRHGFLAFGEIHPDYYQIPVADREALKEMMVAKVEEEPETSDESIDEATTDNTPAQTVDVEIVSESEAEETSRQRPSFLKKYKIQEVIRQGQVMLVQVVKEERGNKGAALTTYLSLAGRFSVLMPNNGKGGGVSRKITNTKDRKALRAIIDKFPIPTGMSVIIRTAGQGKTKTEIKRDYDYLIKTWMKIREDTLESLAPKLIHEEGDIIKRSLRDVFTPDMEEVWVEGESVFKSTRDFMKMLMPGQSKKVKQYKGEEPLFLAYQVEGQLESIHNNVVQLRSGGYLVIDQTEALVAVDVNSGRATREHDIEETALRTNIETCDELARQLRLRDMAGLIVIDFIDMDEPKNNAAIERRLKESLKKDRARIQVGKMSGFGLIEMSRQRLHSSFLESSYLPCPHCGGKGISRSVESCAMHALRVLEEASFRNAGNRILISLPLAVASYLLNNKRQNLIEIENKYKAIIQVLPDESLMKTSDFKLERLREDGERIHINLVNNTRQEMNKDKRKNDNKAKKAVTETPKPQVAQVAQAPQVVKEEKALEVVVDKKTEEGVPCENGSMAQMDAGMDKKSRNNRRRNDWRRKRREKRNQMRQQQTDNGMIQEPTIIGEEKFTVVEQAPITEYNTISEKSESTAVSMPQGDSVQKNNPKQNMNKNRKFSDRKKMPYKERPVQSENKEFVPVIKEAKPIIEEPKSILLPKEKQLHLENKEAAPVVKEPKPKKTENKKQADVSPVSQDDSEQPKRSKRGWWNKLVKSEQ